MDTLSAAFADFKRTGARLAESYLAEGTAEVLGATQRVVAAKFSVVALSAFGIGLSLYGLIFEATLIALSAGAPNLAPNVRNLVAHAIIAAVFGLASFLALSGRHSPK